MHNLHAFFIIVVCSAVTIALRALPFIIFRGGKNTPKFILYLGNALPYAVMGMLVVYCLKNVSVLQAPYGLPELIAGVVVVGSYVWKRNTLLSIIAGTLCYMALVQFVF